jgi:hypothetical protein
MAKKALSVINEASVSSRKYLSVRNRYGSGSKFAAFFVVFVSAISVLIQSYAHRPEKYIIASK